MSIGSSKYREAAEACRNCRRCLTGEFEKMRDEALAVLKEAERAALRALPRPDVVALQTARRAANDCTYLCRREKPLIAEQLQIPA